MTGLGRANNLTLIRICLALMVVVGHFYWLDKPDDMERGDAAHWAGFGVAAFFVISGYLVTASWTREADLGRFYLRRLLRVYPLYIATILILAAIQSAILLARGTVSVADLAGYIGWNAVFANFNAPQMGGLLDGLVNHGINPSLWTLKLELGFYLLLPLIHRLFVRAGWPLLAILFLASTVIALMPGPDARILSQQLPGQFRYFAVGMALHYADADLAEMLRRHRLAALATAGVALAVFAVPVVWTSPAFFALAPILVGWAIYVIAFALPVPVEPIDISYGIYLSHGPIIQLALLANLHRPDATGLAVTVATAAGLAVIGHLAIERPAIAFGRRLQRAATRRAAVTPQASRTDVPGLTPGDAPTAPHPVPLDARHPTFKTEIEA